MDRRTVIKAGVVAGGVVVGGTVLAACSSDANSDAGDTPGEGQKHLKDSTENDGRDQILQPVITRQRSHHECYRPGRRRDHGWAPTGESNRDRHGEGGKKSNTRVNPGENGEGDSFWDQGNSHNETGEDFGAHYSGGKPRGTRNLRNAHRHLIDFNPISFDPLIRRSGWGTL